MAPHGETLIEVITHARRGTAGPQGFTFLTGAQPEQLPYELLYQRGQTCAAALQHEGLRPGDRILVALPTSSDFAALYIGAILAGGVPCVLPAFETARDQPSAIAHSLRVAALLESRFMLVSAAGRERLPVDDLPFRVLTISMLKCTTPESFHLPRVSAHDLALIQASSGTTGQPKCVALSHANVRANLAQMGEYLQLGAHDVIVCWLPLFHDMGLIGCVWLSIYCRMRAVFLSPYQFLRRPSVWLRAISDYRGTISPAPNFAYALATRRCTAHDLEGIDLSTWGSAVCGAEPIDLQILQRFADHFAPYGLRRESLLPSYGLAEAALCVAMHQPGQPLHAERLALAAYGNTVQNRAPTARMIVSCGRPLPGTRLRIVGNHGNALPDGQIGDLWITGPSITGGYYGAPDASRDALRDGWLDTGDRGYLHDGKLFLTGRRKDMIIMRGQNYQPLDFEHVAAEIAGPSSGQIVAFGVYSAETASEELGPPVELEQEILINDIG